MSQSAEKLESGLWKYVNSLIKQTRIRTFTSQDKIKNVEFKQWQGKFKLSIREDYTVQQLLASGKWRNHHWKSELNYTPLYSVCSEIICLHDNLFD